MVRHTHGPIAHSPADSHYLDVGAVVTNVVADLLQTTQCGETAYRVGKDNVPLESKSGGDPGHVLLGNPHIQKLTRVAGDEIVQHPEAKVTCEEHKIRVLGRERIKRMDKGVSHDRRSNSARAASYSAPRGIL